MSLGREITRRVVIAYLTSCFLVCLVSVTDAQFDRTRTEIRPLVDARVTSPSMITIYASDESQNSARFPTCSHVPNYRIDEEIFGSWKIFATAFPTDPLISKVSPKVREQLDQFLRKEDEIGGGPTIHLGFRNDRLIYIYWDKVPSESSEPWRTVRYDTPNGTWTWSTKINVGFIDSHPSPLFLPTIARIRGKFGTWTNPPWQFAMFPSLGGIERVVIDTYLGSSGNTSYYAANTYNYYRGHSLNRIVALSPERDCYWISELLTTVRSDKTGQELEAKHAYLLEPEAFWRMIFAELLDIKRNLRSPDAPKKVVFNSARSLTNYTYESAFYSGLSYDQLLVAYPKRVAMAVFAAMEHPKVSVDVVKAYGRDGQQLNEFDPDAFASDVAGLLVSTKASNETKLKILELLTWWKSKLAVLNLVRVLEVKVNPKLEAEVLVVREATAKTLFELTGQNLGTNAPAWRQWMRDNKQ